MITVNPRIVSIQSLEQARIELKRMGVDQGGINWMAPKSIHRCIKLSNIKGKQANILKQEMLARGAECAVFREALVSPEQQGDVMLMGTIKQFKQVAEKLKLQPFGLKQIAAEIIKAIENFGDSQVRTMNAGPYTLEFGRRTLVMGILNFTPDSFSDGGRFNDLDVAIARAHAMIEEGADIIDIGGESTRPGYTMISDEEEIARITPIISRLAKEITVPISIDSYKSGVVKAAINAGATIINDIWGLRYDPSMCKVVAESGLPYIMMHNQDGTEYREFMPDMLQFFREGCQQLEAGGGNIQQVILDPGVGFGKTYEHNLEAIARLQELKVLGLPILLGTSRKSVIAQTLQLPVDERVEGTAATCAVGISQGADIIRVHDVKGMARVAKMTDAMVRRVY